MGPAQFLVAFLYGLLEFIYGAFMIIHDKAVGIYHKETSTRMRLFEEQQARGELQLKFQTICALFDDQSTKLNDCERLNEKLKHTVKSLEEPKKLLEAQLYRLQTSLTRREGHDGVQETTINNLKTTNKSFKGRVERRDRKIEELREASVKLKEQNDLLKIGNEQKRLAIVELQPIQTLHFADDAKRVSQVLKHPLEDKANQIYRTMLNCATRSSNGLRNYVCPSLTAMSSVLNLSNMPEKTKGQSTNLLLGLVP